jgi:hypothetical protein
MKRMLTLLFAAAVTLGPAAGASAVDFAVKGEWLVGLGVGDTDFIRQRRDPGETKRRTDNRDKFAALQRMRLQLDAVASEDLSGTVFFEMGNTKFGENESGGALGADRSIVGLKYAYLDWTVPNTPLKLRMGLQEFALPGLEGSAVFDTDAVAGIAASWEFNENVSLTAVWARPYNDNYNPNDADNWPSRDRNANYLDNMDLFVLLLPMKFDGFEATPWVMYGMGGRNFGNFADFRDGALPDGRMEYTLSPYPAAMGDPANWSRADKPYGSMFWAGLPVTISALEPWNIEFDINYGFVESMRRFDTIDAGGDVRRSSTQRSGWVAKALLEYKFDWGVPGLFGWYGSGDDGNPKNGSERMPSVAPTNAFTSFMGDRPDDWVADDSYYNRGASYSGTWGIGMRVKDVSFIEDLQHSFTVAYRGGTNSPSMVKYMENSYDWDSDTVEGPYMTTKDGMLEFNQRNTWQVYENLTIELELAYIVNLMDNATWNKTRNGRGSSYDKQDIWRAQAMFVYAF